MSPTECSSTITGQSPPGLITLIKIHVTIVRNHSHYLFDITTAELVEIVSAVLVRYSNHWLVSVTLKLACVNIAAE